MRSALIALLLLPLSLAARSAQADPIIGEMAPALGDAALSASLKSGVVVVDFFATWCGPCHEAIAVLDELTRRRGLALVIVDVGEPPERVRAYFAGHPLPPGARLVLDGEGEAARRWGQHRFPTTFVLGAGQIRHINRGYGPGYARRLDQWVAATAP